MEKKVLIIIVLLIIVTVLSIGLFYQSATDEHNMTKESEKHDHSAELVEGYYTCPMHKDVIVSEAGSCPQCGMSLVFVEGELEHSDHGEGEFYCPMHPEVVKTSPGSCPVCEMQLVKKEA